MGVYHFMGLGRSIGAVTAPLSYLAVRLQRYDEGDRQFFSGSGEVAQPSDQKRGDVQGIVLFTTPEIFEGLPGSIAEKYITNRRGGRQGNLMEGGTVPRELRRLLPSVLCDLTSRKQIDLYWCLYDRGDPALTFERAARTLAAAKGVGKAKVGLGKETWINLTGGSNIINTALNLAVSLLGVSARMYYIISDDIRCLYHTIQLPENCSHDQFWIDLPIIYADFNAQHRALLEELATTHKPLTVSQLHHIAMGSLPAFYDISKLDEQAFNRQYLIPLINQRLIVRQGNVLTIGAGWTLLLERYYQSASRYSAQASTLEELAAGAGSTWLRHEILVVR